MKKEMLYEGKAKQIFATDNQDEVLVYYKDDATAGNGAKKGTILNKGIMNNKISSFFFKLLKERFKAVPKFIEVLLAFFCFMWSIFSLIKPSFSFTSGCSCC